MINLHLFNPGYEMSVMTGKTSYTPAKNVARLIKELSALPLWYAEDGDYVLTDEASFELLSEQLPEGIVPLGKPVLLSEENRESMDCSPWGISPEVLSRFERLKDRYGLDMNVPSWNGKLRELTSRRTSKKVLTLLREKGVEIPFVPEFVTSVEEAESYINELKGPVVLKTPFSSSGRGVLMLDKGILSDKDARWISGAIDKQGEVSVEPYLGKKLDFALEYISKGGEVEFDSISVFKTLDGGAYVGNMLNTQKELRKIIESYMYKGEFDRIVEVQAEALKQIYAPYYEGNIGIDMMIYMCDSFGAGVYPCVEINMRRTMGSVSADLYKKYVVEGSTGSYSIIAFGKDGEAFDYYNQNKLKPIEVENGRVKSGVLILTPVSPETKFVALMNVIRN
jgi:hypothetical protein